MKCAVIIVAAGRGTRLGGSRPKQYIPLNGECALRRSTTAFLAFENVQCVQPVIHFDDSDLYSEAMRGMTDNRLLPPCFGGDTRAATVLAGLEAVASTAPDYVLIHDAARPFVPRCVIESVIGELEHSEGACAGLPVVDALWKAEDSTVLESIERSGLWRAQTPQGFHFEDILKAHRAHDGSAVDDVAVARDFGLTVTFVNGSEQNYKITTQADLDRALRDTA